MYSIVIYEGYGMFIWSANTLEDAKKEADRLVYKRKSQDFAIVDIYHEKTLVAHREYGESSSMREAA